MKFGQLVNVDYIDRKVIYEFMDVSHYISYVEGLPLCFILHRRKQMKEVGSHILQEAIKDNKGIKSYEDLRVFQLAYQLAMGIFWLTIIWQEIRR